MVARLLFIGDMHLGRRPSRLPDDLDTLGLRRSELGPAAAWRASIDHALSTGVDAVVLAGDVVEGIDDRFEAYRDLKAGALQLAGAGIPLIGVAGNHDVEALPRLARQIPAFRLLGAAGRWETVDVATRSGVPVRLLGWSFPAPRVERSPLDSLDLDLDSARQSGVATLGVLHCDVDAGSSRYAPVSSRALAALPVDGFLLGHIHRPDRLEGDRPQGYLGSLVGLDPGEPGRRGPWLIEVEGPGRVHAHQIPLAPIRFERGDLELGQLDESDAADLQDRLFAALRSALEAVRDRVADDSEPGMLRMVGCRIRIKGRGRHHARVRALLGATVQHVSESWDGVHYYLEKVEEEGAPDLDLERIAEGDDPPALVAQRLLLLQRDGPERDGLLRRAARRLEEETSGLRWQRVGTPLEPGPELCELMQRAATLQLEALLAQRSEIAPASRTSRAALAVGEGAGGAGEDAG